MEKNIEIRGAKAHNLKNIDIDIPLNQITCFFGPSGSGKTSIAFHTLLNESKRRFLNSFPSSVRLFTDKPTSVDVESIIPVKPVFSLPQNNPIIGTRNNITDTMGLTSLFQNLFWNLSSEYCSEHHLELRKKAYAEQVQEQLDQNLPDRLQFFVHKKSFLNKLGGKVLPSRVWNSEKKITEFFNPMVEYWELARLKKDQLYKIKEYTEGEGGVLYFEKIYFLKNKKLIEINLTDEKQCPSCNTLGLKNINSNYFSPLNAQGACKACDGFGENLNYDVKKIFDIRKSVEDQEIKIFNYRGFSRYYEDLLVYLKTKKVSKSQKIEQWPQDVLNGVFNGDKKFIGLMSLIKKIEKKKYKTNVRILLRNWQSTVKCNQCYGTRLNHSVINFYLKSSKLRLNMRNILDISLDECFNLFANYLHNESKNLSLLNIAFVKKILANLKIAKEIGLGHLNLLRKTKSLSAGEYQRVLLIKYLSFEGTDSVFVLDEPSTGLENGQIDYLMQGMGYLKKQGNTIIIIDHSEYLKSKVDYLVEMGPGAGYKGGEIQFKGIYNDWKNQTKKTKKIEASTNILKIDPSKKEMLEFKNASIFNQEFSNFKIYLNHFYQVIGPSGSGKSSLIVKTLANELSYLVNDKYITNDNYKINGLKVSKDIRDVIVIDANINRYTSRSTIGSMTELAKVVRQHFASLQVSKSLGLTEKHFNPNSVLGQCDECDGKGVIQIEMHLLDDIVLTCEKCHGKKLKQEIVEISDGQMTVYEAFNRPIHKVLKNIRLTAKFKKVLSYLENLNLDYLNLDRSLISLSGGEKQRIYLLSKLLKKLEDSIIIFENLSFGLSDLELAPLSQFLLQIQTQGNTLILIDKNPLFKNYVNGVIEFNAQQKIKITHLK